MDRVGRRRRPAGAPVLAPNGGFDEITTSQMSQYIEKGQVDEITFIDGDQEIQATLDSGAREGGESDKVMTHYIQGQQETILALVDAQVAEGTIAESNSENPQPSLLGWILATLLPFALIILLFIFLMNQVQGGGGRGVMQFAKSKAKLISKDMPKTTFSDVAGCDEAIEESRRSRSSSRSRPSSRRWAPRSPRACSSTASRAPARCCGPCGRRRGRGSLLLIRAPTSSRCWSASAPAACATSSSRPRRCAGHRLDRRDRRRGPPSPSRHGWRSRRA